MNVKSLIKGVKECHGGSGEVHHPRVCVAFPQVAHGDECSGHGARPQTTLVMSRGRDSLPRKRLGLPPLSALRTLVSHYSCLSDMC